MPRKYLFLTTLPIALCFFLQCGSFRNDSEGIYVHDRMYQVPLRKDIWDAGKKRVNARNGMVIAGTGGGKSAFTLNLTQQLIEQDYTVVVVEFGKSFSQLCRLYPDISLHVDYDGRTALGINPFDLQGEELDNGSIEMLSGSCRNTGGTCSQRTSRRRRWPSPVSSRTITRMSVKGTISRVSTTT